MALLAAAARGGRKITQEDGKSSRGVEKRLPGFIGTRTDQKKWSAEVCDDLPDFGVRSGWYGMARSSSPKRARR